uniref:Uncharacterized protein n=1 Tax=Setaria italica TaxID=4555 RepID=K3ZJX5_SETIT
MGRYIMRTGSTGLGSILFTSPRITGHRHRRVRSPSPAALVVFKKAPRPLQHSLCGVGVSCSLPVRNDPQVISAANGVTHSVGDDGVEPPPGRPGKPGTKDGAALGQGGSDGTPGTTGAGDDLELGVPGKPDDVGGDGLATGKPGKMGLRGLAPPGRPGYRSTLASDVADAAVYLAASDGRAAAAATATITAASTTAM